MPRDTSLLEPELMDRDTIDPLEDERALADLDRVTRGLFGLGALRRALLPRLGAGMCVLDVGAGSGLAALDLQRRAARRGAALRVVCLDRRLRHLLAGRRRPGAAWRVVGDAFALPFRDGAVDWASSSLFFHHFDAVENRRVVGEMRRVAARGVVVSDLRRTPWGPWLLRLCFPWFAVGAVARHDGLVSLARAWSLREVERWLEGEASPYELRRRFPVRFTAVLAAGR
jgi:ubiquinone/menaquinone biosynthesis C-methylase UbiE